MEHNGPEEDARYRPAGDGRGEPHTFDYVRVSSAQP